MDVFEYLKNCVGCDFISDLKSEKHKTEAINALSQMDKSNIDPRQLTDVSSYLGITTK